MTENDRKYLRKRLLMMSEYYDRAVESPNVTSPAVLAWMNETWVVLADIVRMLDEKGESDGQDEGDIHRDA